MRDVLQLMGEFRYLDKKRLQEDLNPREERRWVELSQYLGDRFGQAGGSGRSAARSSAGPEGRDSAAPPAEARSSAAPGSSTASGTERSADGGGTSSADSGQDAPPRRKPRPAGLAAMDMVKEFQYLEKRRAAGDNLSGREKARLAELRDYLEDHVGRSSKSGSKEDRADPLEGAGPLDPAHAARELKELERIRRERGQLQPAQEGHYRRLFDRVIHYAQLAFREIPMRGAGPVHFQVTRSVDPRVQPAARATEAPPEAKSAEVSPDSQPDDKGSEWQEALRASRKAPPEWLKEKHRSVSPESSPGMEDEPWGEQEPPEQAAEDSAVEPGPGPLPEEPGPDDPSQQPSIESSVESKRPGWSGSYDWISPPAPDPTPSGSPGFGGGGGGDGLMKGVRKRRASPFGLSRSKKS